MCSGLRTYNSSAPPKANIAAWLFTGPTQAVEDASECTLDDARCGHYQWLPVIGIERLVIRFVTARSGLLSRLAALVLLALALALAAPLPALAQSAGDVLTQQQETLNSIARQTDTLAAQMETAPDNDTQLVDIRLKLDKLSRDLLQSGLAFRPRLAEINTRLEQLGSPPAEGEPPEPEAVSQERARLQEEKARINVVIGDAEALSLRVNRLIERIGEMRRDLFARTLSRRYDLSAALSQDVVQEFQRDLGRVYTSVSSWGRFVVQFKLRSLLLATFLALAAAAVLLIGGRRLFGDLIKADLREEEPSYLSRLSVAFWSTLIPSAAFAVFLAAAFFFLSYFNIPRGDISELLLTLFRVSAIVFFVLRLARAVLEPRKANWRLMPVRTRAASTLFYLTAMTAFVTGFDYFMDRLYEVFGAQLTLTVTTSLIATVVVGILVILIALVKPFHDGEERPRPWPVHFRYLLIALGAATIIAAILGYIGFARFLSQQIVFTGAILATMYIGFLTAAAVAREGEFAQSALGRGMAGRWGLSDTALDQLGLVAGIIINVLVVFVGVPLILMQWGFHWTDMTTWMLGVAQEIRVGTLSFSIFGILTGLLVFVIGYVVTRWFQNWIDGSVMARSHVDTGVRNSIRTTVGYAGIALAALIGISAAGIDLTHLALVAGALSLGIGFGLQNIVSNFVSGLILLAERPFKAGDWIVAGPVSGTVKKVSVRATEIETFQRQTIILPNSELINSAVGNWTHKNNLGRLEIPVGVAYGSDVKRVHAILLDIASNHPLVLKNPEPFVLFAGFGDSSLDFEIRVFLADILTQLEVQNDIRFAVIDAFQTEGIEIPFPQRDIHLKTGLFAQQTPAASETGAAETPARPRRRRRTDPE